MLLLALIASAAALLPPAAAPPIGPLPAGPTTIVAAQTGQLVAVALPRRSGGRTWRIARVFDSSILHQVSKVASGSTVVVVFRTTRAGGATLAFALTKGESPKALESRTYRVRVAEPLSNARAAR
jgi:hypothetical protein